MEYSSGMTFDNMHYRGFVARVEYDEDDRIFVGHLTGIRDIVGFHSDTLDGLQAELHVSVDSYLECEAQSSTK